MKSETGWNLHSGRPDDTYQQERRFKSSSKGQWVVMALIALALAGAVTLGYPELQKHGVMLTQIPGLQDALNAAGKKIEAAEENLRSWNLDLDSLRQRVAGLDARLGSGLRAAKKEMQEAATRSQQRAQAELDQHMEKLRTRLERIEAGQQVEQARTAKLEEEVAGVRGQLSRQVARLEQDRAGDLANAGQQMTRLDQRIDNGRRDFDTFAKRFDRQRIGFEAGLNHRRELAPGVSLTVSHTDVSHQTANGWVWLMPDRRTLWLRGRGLQQPLTFYSAADGRPRELVLTRVTKYSVIGYLVLPDDTRSSARTPVVEGRDQAVPSGDE
ncbi:MAG: hypothetical protein HYR60_18970 [Acidobacteria bacterium]|nr:hypothetical protein [Acidobacteriota bacterium]